MTIPAAEAVVWTNREAKEVRVLTAEWNRPGRLPWCDPIGAHYSQWRKMTTKQRQQLLLETALDLAMQGYPLDHVLREFAKITEFRALGAQSYPMCRALTQAMVGQCLEMNTMTFEELLKHYGERKTA